MELLSRIWDGLAGRNEGPMSMRLVFQPLVAAAFALRDGLKDSRAGRPAWLWAAFRQADQRRELLRSGWKSVSKVFCMAVVLDLVYQWIVNRPSVRISVALLAGVLLALLPYSLIRGPVNRIAGLMRRPRHE